MRATRLGLCLVALLKRPQRPWTRRRGGGGELTNPGMLPHDRLFEITPYSAKRCSPTKLTGRVEIVGFARAGEAILDHSQHGAFGVGFHNKLGGKVRTERQRTTFGVVKKVSQNHSSGWIKYLNGRCGNVVGNVFVRALVGYPRTTLSGQNNSSYRTPPSADCARPVQKLKHAFRRVVKDLFVYVLTCRPLCDVAASRLAPTRTRFQFHNRPDPRRRQTEVRAQILRALLTYRLLASLP